MRTLILILFIIAFPFNSFATCSSGYSPLNLDPDVAPTTYTYDAANMTWDVTAPYGHLTGIAVCNSTEGTRSTASGTDFPTGTSGVHCWCKMLSPGRSAWVYSIESSSASDCASSCAAYCGARVRNRSDFRSALFGSACTPNTITINWKNASGGTMTSGSCTYDDTLTTPTSAPTPPRGYVFTGWAFE